MSSARSRITGEDGKLTSREGESEVLQGHARGDAEKAVRWSQERCWAGTHRQHSGQQ